MLCVDLEEIFEEIFLSYSQNFTEACRAMRTFSMRIVGFCLISGALGFNGLTSLYNTHEEPPIDSDDYKSTIGFTSKEKWITQKLDHFNPQDSREWEMRYLENDRFLQPGGPIFIFIGGEWEITPGYVSAGLMFEMAKELNGTMYYTEHRYYGKSHPTSDTSTENLKHLTIEQALADLAFFIESVKASSDGLKDSGVIVVGASYSATMATWVRLKYPHLITGAWASSAPLLAKIDFFEYNEVMTESVKSVGGEKCLRSFENAFKILEGYVATAEPKNLLKIKTDFQLCEPLKLDRDVEHFFYEMSDTVAGLVQSHRFGDIEKACKCMLDASHSDDAAALGAWVNSKKKKKCLNMNYEDTVKMFNNATWGSEANKQLRQWTYQTCDSFGWFQTGTSLNQAFGSKHPQIEYFIKMCADLFDNQFNLDDIKKHFERTNAMFNGLDLKVTNVYSTHGQLDPWRAVGLQKDLNDEAPVEVLHHYSHVPDLLSISKTDTVQMKASKNRIRELVRKWLNVQ